MFESTVGDMRSRLEGSPAHCGLPESCTEGFWSQIPRTSFSWSCWSTLKCLRRLNFRDLAKIVQNRDFGQNLMTFFVLIPVNHCKHFLLLLGFVWDVLGVFCATRLTIMFETRPKSRQFHSKKDTESTQISSRIGFLNSQSWGRPPVPAGLVLVETRRGRWFS